MITYIADIGQDIDDLIAIQYLHSTGKLDSVVLDGFSRDLEREKIIIDLGIKIKEMPETSTIFCGGAFTKIQDYIQTGGKVDLVVANGFFAGCNIVPEKHVLQKFKNKLTCKSYNPNLDKTAAQFVLMNCNCLIVSKNVCHHEDNVRGRWHENFWDCKPTKKLHDLLMAKEGISYLDKALTLCEYKEVFIYRNGDEWGAEENYGGNVKISISYKE